MKTEALRDVLKNHSLPIQIEGFPYILAGLLLFLSSIVIWKGMLSAPEGTPLPAAIASILFGLFTLFSVWFYRNPTRPTPQDDVKAVISPADGRVLKIEEVAGTKIGQPKAKKVSIFMSPMDVHVNRAPVTGSIEAVQYHKGKFFKADLDKASEENEHNWVIMRTPSGAKVAFVQIAGFIARRIVCYVDSGQSLSRGERFGMIRFGSRMEVVVPVDSEVLIKPGERVTAGLTKVARLQ